MAQKTVTLKSQKRVVFVKEDAQDITSIDPASCVANLETGVHGFVVAKTNRAFNLFPKGNKTAAAVTAIKAIEDNWEILIQEALDSGEFKTQG